MKQDAYTLHKPVRQNFKRNHVLVGGIDEQWQMDLADMQSLKKYNDGYRYLLVCIDVFSKYAWVIPLKTKTGLALVEAFKGILSLGRKPEKILTDPGTEFFNKHFLALMSSEEIHLYNTFNETNASIVDRLICTLKTKMWRYFTAKRTLRYIDMLSDLILLIITVSIAVLRRNLLFLITRMKIRYGMYCMMMTLSIYVLLITSLK